MNWLDRQSFLGEDSDETLTGITVGIVGLGGGGSHVVLQLAHVGAGGFVLLDDDHITETNLNRLVGGTREDVARGARKFDIAERVIRAVNPDARVAGAAAPWQESLDLLLGCDVVFGCIDNVRGKDDLEAHCRRLMIPYIDQGMDVHGLADGFLIAGQVVLSVPGSPCLRCLGVVTEEALDEEGRNYGAAGGKPQVVWPNGVLASTAVGLFMQLVTPWHRSARAGACLEYDGNAGTVRPSDRHRRLSGRPCPHRLPAELGDPAFDVRAWARSTHTADQPVSAEVPTGTAGPAWQPSRWLRILRWFGA
jgi:hypothetical protein